MTTPAGKAMFQMMGVFAEFEQAMIRERVRAGIARAKADGKHQAQRIREALGVLGRPGIRGIASSSG